MLLASYAHAVCATDPECGDADSSMLLPEHALKQDDVIASYNAGAACPSLFDVIALEDGVKVEWTPPQTTAGAGLAAIAGQTGQG